MKTRVAINGFGRIGRMAFRIIAERSDIEVVGINDLTDTKTLAHLLKHDTNYGQFSHNVEHDDTSIIVDGVHIPVSCIKDATTLPWGNLQVDVVIESTGRFVTTEAASAHLQAGAKKVVLSAPAKDDGPALTATINVTTVAAEPEQLEIVGNVTTVPAATCNGLTVSSYDRFHNISVPSSEMRIELEEADRLENELSLLQGSRLLSAYRAKSGVKFWIITEASRDITTVLLPEDY
jgi:D-arabinose 1-dehydrogenase-like Zn-dependent alcohol dehydrogenase